MPIRRAHAHGANDGARMLKPTCFVNAATSAIPTAATKSATFLCICTCASERVCACVCLCMCMHACVRTHLHPSFIMRVRACVRCVLANMRVSVSGAYVDACVRACAAVVNAVGLPIERHLRCACAPSHRAPRSTSHTCGHCSLTISLGIHPRSALIRLMRCTASARCVCACACASE